MDQYRQTGSLNDDFQQRLNRYESLLKSQGGHAPTRAPDVETGRADESVDAASEDIDLSGFESTSHAPVEDSGRSESHQAEGFEPPR